MSERAWLLLLAVAFVSAAAAVVYLVLGEGASGAPVPVAQPPADPAPAKEGGRAPRTRTYTVRKPIGARAGGVRAVEESAQASAAPAASGSGGGTDPPGFGGAADRPDPAPRPTLRTTVPSSGRR